MDWIQDHLLTAILFTPVVGAVSIALMNREKHGRIRWLALFFSVLAFVLAAAAFSKFSPDQPGMQFVERTSWISSPHIDYFIGADGLSLLMVLLSTF
ncbi:MAG: hypothetical protein V3T65_01300, partial [Acidobacteriota bacterium]